MRLTLTTQRILATLDGGEEALALAYAPRRNGCGTAASATVAETVVARIRHDHTCTTLDAQPCAACEALTDAWALDHGHAHLREMGTGYVADASAHLAPVAWDDMESVGMAGTTDTDPQRAYETDRDAARAALRDVLAREAVMTDHIRAGAAWRRSGNGGPLTDVLSGIRETGRINRTRADYRATQTLIRAAYGATGTVGTVETVKRATGYGTRVGFADTDTRLTEPENVAPALITGTRDARHIPATGDGTARMAGESNSPAMPTGEIGWAARARDDARTLAGPVVTGIRAWAVSTDGTTRPTIAPLRVTREMVKHEGKGETRSRTAWTDVLVAHPSTDDARAMLTIRAARDGATGTRWSPDASTYAADRFAAATAPVGPVAKRNTRKRPRDGRMGGSAVITSAPTRGAR